MPSNRFDHFHQRRRVPDYFCRLSTGLFFLASLAVMGLVNAADPSGSVTQALVKAELTAAKALWPKLELGRDLYLRNCLICHQSQGQGLSDGVPPLAKSDLLQENLERAIKAVVEGLSGEIVVLGKKYKGTMPPIVINDEDVANVFTYVLNNWGNSGGAISSATVKEVRSRSGYPTFERLQQTTCYAPLPTPPVGFRVREVTRLPQCGVRLASDGEGRLLYVLTAGGDGSDQICWTAWVIPRRQGCRTQSLSYVFACNWNAEAIHVICFGS